MDYQGFVKEYKNSLNDLNFNSKALINTLTMLAGENVPAATSIQTLIEDQIIFVSPATTLHLPSGLCMRCELSSALSF